MIEFKTGRTYDTAQVLQITVEKEKQQDGFSEVTALFVDASRGIEGRVNVILFPSDTLGVEVLAVYDAGNYSPTQYNKGS